jgi:WD40 repeat protein
MALGLSLADFGAGMKPEPMPSTNQAKLVYSLKSLTTSINALAFSPDRKLLAAGSRDGSARIWDISSGKAVDRCVFRAAEGIRSLAFSSDGLSLAAGLESGVISIHDPSQSSKEIRQLRGAKGAVLAVCYSPDGKMVAGAGEDRTLRLWRTTSGSEPRTVLQGHTKPIVALTFSPNAKCLVTGGQDSTARIWSLGGIRPGQIMSLPHGGEVCTLAFADRTTLLTSGNEKTIWLWDLSAPKASIRSRLTGHANATKLVLVTPDGDTVVSVGAGSEVANWSLKHGRMRRDFGLPPAEPTRFALTADGRYLARGQADGTIEVFRVAEKRS